MKRLIIQALPILLIGFFAVGSALAEGQKHGEGKEGKHGDQWLQELNLSPEQKEQLKAIKEKYHDDMKKKKTAMKEARKALQEALKTDASDASLKKQFEALQAKKAQFAELRFEKILAIRAILTPEQRQKFQGMRGRHHKRHDR